MNGRKKEIEKTKVVSLIGKGLIPAVARRTLFILATSSALPKRECEILELMNKMKISKMKQIRKKTISLSVSISSSPKEI